MKQKGQSIFRLVSGSIPPKKNVKLKNMGNLSKRKPYTVSINRNNQQVNSILKQTCIYSLEHKLNCNQVYHITRLVEGRKVNVEFNKHFKVFS